MTKQPKTKKAGSSRKAPKKAAKTARTKPTKAPTKRKRDLRLPAPGTVLTREYKGKTIRVTVQEEGFRWERKEYRSLRAGARGPAVDLQPGTGNTGRCVRSPGSASLKGWA